MNKDKEPLLSAEDYFLNTKGHQYTTKWMEAYAKYHTEYHIRQCSEVVCENTELKQETEYIDCNIGYAIVSKVDKQSITNAIENYIKENL